MDSYEYVLVDSYKRSDGTPTNFKFELNKKIKNINCVELVHSSFSNTIHNITNKNKLYWQEEANYRITSGNTFKYKVKDVLNLNTEKTMRFRIRIRSINDDGDEVFNYKPINSVDGFDHYVISFNTDYDWDFQRMTSYIQTEMRRLTGIDTITCKQISGSSQYLQIKTNDEDIKIKFFSITENSIYDYLNLTINNNTDLTMTYSDTIISNGLPNWVSDERSFILNDLIYTDIDTLADNLQSLFDQASLNRIESGFTIFYDGIDKIQLTSRKIIKFTVDNFLFESNIYKNIFISNEVKISSEIKSFNFPSGSYTIDDLTLVIKTQMNVISSHGGYSLDFEEGNFKIDIKNDKPFKLLFSKQESIFRQLGYKQEDTDFNIEHVSDHTINLDSIDAILVNITGLPTIINTKNTSGSFLITVDSQRGDININYKNSTFEQKVKVNNLDLSSLQITLIDTDSNILSSDELNLKMLFKCYINDY